MSAPPPSSGISAAVHAVLDSPRFSAVLASTIMGTVVFGHAIRSVLGWPGFIAALALLGLLAVGVLLQRRDQFEWQGILPISLLAFVGWCALSVIWSQYQWASLSGVIYQIGVALLAVFVAIGRDLIQIVRGLGDVLRVALGASVAVEILSGIILDTPFAFLGITGSLANGGPIQGVFGSRNLLGLVCLIAAITFAVELATKSIPRNLGVASLLLTVAVFGLTRSPVGGFIAAGAGVAAVALTSLRRTDPDTRRRLQIAFAGLAVLGGLTAYLARARIVDLFNAGGELSLRLSLWAETANLTSANSIEGWGWVGTWRSELLPFLVLRTANGRVPTSALNAYLDVWFQLGLVGLVIFVAFLGLALTRAWIVASNRRNVAHVWPALILVAVAVASMAESSALVEIGWFLLVVCAVKAAQELSWRSGLR